jgi:hypothetical protein
MVTLQVVNGEKYKLKLKVEKKTRGEVISLGRKGGRKEGWMDGWMDGFIN